MKSHYLMVILLISVQRIYCAYKGHHVYFTGVQCDNFDRKILPFIECLMLPDAHNQLMLNVRFKLTQEITKDFIMNFLVTVEMNGRNSTYLNFKLDVCEALESAQNHFILRLLLHELQRKSDVHLACPIKANVMYEIHNMSIDNKYALGFAPSAKFMSSAKFYYENKKFLNLQTFGRVDKIK